MKIVHISIFPPKGEKHSSEGGVASYTSNLITSIPYSKEDKIFILCNKVLSFEKYTLGQIEVRRCFKRNFTYVFSVLREIRRINPDIIHIQQELGLFGGILTAYLLQYLLLVLIKKKIIVTLHGVVSLKLISKEFVRQNRSSLPTWMVKLGFFVIYKPICILATKIIVHEAFFKEILIEEYKVKREKIEVIPHGVEDLKPVTKDNASKLLNINPKKKIILFMGYLSGYKDIDLLIEGFSEFLKFDRNSFLIIAAGKHPKLKNDESYLMEYDRLFEKAKKILPSNSYRWVGFIKEEEIKKYYSVSDVSLYPYIIAMSSSGPMAISIGFKKPFLASNNFRHVIENKDLLFANTKEDLSKKLSHFFSEKSNYDYYINRIRKERLWVNVGTKTMNLYKDIYEFK